MLSVQHVSKSFHTKGRLVPAVDDVSLDIDHGECLAVIGETGSGKSTLSKIVLGLLEPDAGVVTVRGDRWAGGWKSGRSPHRLDVQPVFQNPQQSLNPRRRIGDALAQAMRARTGAAAESDIVALFERVGLPGGTFLRRLPGELSGGQLQRVAIARALAAGPSLIVADEPTSALDVSIRAGVLNVLDGLRRSEGVSILLVTHDILVARAMSAKTVVMQRGHVVESGSTDVVLNGGATAEYTKRLIAAVPAIGHSGNVSDIEPTGKGATTHG